TRPPKPVCSLGRRGMFAFGRRQDHHLPDGFGELRDSERSLRALLWRIFAGSFHRRCARLAAWSCGGDRSRRSTAPNLTPFTYRRHNPQDHRSSSRLWLRQLYSYSKLNMSQSTFTSEQLQSSPEQALEQCANLNAD